jgi:hypothetical protein
MSQADRTREPGPGGGVHVERLALRVAGLDENAARALARLVAEKLADGLLLPSGTSRLDSLRAEVRLSAGDPAEPGMLAQRIADQVGRVLARDRAAGGPDAELTP